MKRLPFFILIMVSATLFSQSFVGTSPRKMPVKYLKPDSIIISEKKVDKNLQNQFWYVWIDREGVRTTNGMEPQFLEKFFVVDEDPTRLHIVKGNDSFDNSLGQFIKEPVDYGWVPKDNCLLTPYALYSTKTHFRIKVMTITTPELMSSEFERIRNGEKKLAFFNTPDSKTPNNNETPLFEIFYVLKSEKNRLLLCKREDIKDGNAIDYVNGWVDINRVQVWHQRHALEPNWEPDFAARRKSQMVKCSVFTTEEEAKLFSDGKNQKLPFWNDDTYSVRKDPYFKRFPVFDKKIDKDLIETAVVSKVMTSSGDTLDPEETLLIERKMNEMLEKIKNINLVFVIDGTQSMGPYLKSVQKAVTQSATSLYLSESSFKFGAVIYRDYDDPAKDQCYEVQPLTDQKTFSRFINGVTTTDPKCFDNTTSEGLYLGLKKVDEVLNGKESQTNIIILIGDSGDRNGQGRIGQDDVMPIITKYNCGILAMQVHRLNDNSYDDFFIQVRAMALGINTALAEKNSKEAGKLNLPGLSTKPQWISTSEQNRKLYNLSNASVPGALETTARGEEISSETASDEIKKIIEDLDQKNRSNLKIFQDLLRSRKRDSLGAFSPEILNILRQGQFTWEQINILQEKRYQFMIKGFTPLKVNALKNDQLYNYVLFLDQGELDDIRENLGKLYNPNQTASQRRTALKETWLEMLRANYGVSKNEIAGKSFAEWFELATGLPSLNPLLKKYKIEDLEDKVRLPDGDFEQILQTIKRKRDDLTKVSHNPKYMFMSNFRYYYWIPQSLLP